MTQDELNRFLQGVRRTRLADYLAPEPGETLSAALDRKIRWAARVRNQPEVAAESSFLLQHQDALRGEVTRAALPLEEDWVEFADAGEEHGRSPWGGKSVSKNESIEFDTVDPFAQPAGRGGAPAPPKAPRSAAPQRPNPPKPAPAPRPASIARPSREVPTPDRTPTPFGVPPKESRRSPSPLLDRARRRSVSPLTGRQRQAGPQPTPSPPLLSGRTATPVVPPAEGSPRPTPARWTSGTPAAHRSPSPAQPAGFGARSSAGPSYSPPVGGSPPVGTPPGAGLGRRLASATPAPPRPDSPRVTPPPSIESYDVRVTGADRFVRSNDLYGTSQVVYEPELEPSLLRGGAPTPPSVSMSRRDDKPRPDDILGNLRSTARTKDAAPPVQRPAGRPPGLPPWAPWAIILTLATVGLLIISGINTGRFNSLLGPAVADTGADPNQRFGFGSSNPISPSEAHVAPPLSPLAPADLLVTPQVEAPQVPTEPAPEPAPEPKPVKPVESEKPQVRNPRPEVKPKPDPVPESKPVEIPVEVKPDPPPPPAPVAKMTGAWQGNVGPFSCLADLSQRGDTVEGAITVNGNRIRVSGRYNAEKQTLYLKGIEDENIYFRGEVREDRRVDGTARLGAGKLNEAWTIRK